nr:hypothetical protein [Rhodoferax sp.]
MNVVHRVWRFIPTGVWVMLLLIGLAVLYRAYIGSAREAEAKVGVIGVVAPDGMSRADAKLSVWLDALNEQGLRNAIVPVSSLVSESIWGRNAAADYRVLVLPDQILQRSDARLLRFLQTFVADGGQLLVCYDAMTRNEGAGTHTNGVAQLSGLVGVDYALFDTLGAGAFVSAPVLGSDADMTLLQVPPGKAVPWPTSASGLLALTTYQYGFVMYPHLATRGAYGGKRLLESTDGSVILGERAVGRGRVVFANLPLGDLKGRTDGLLLHAVLSHMGKIAGLPALSAAPNGIGGLVFNWHIDANTALPALAEFDRRGLFAQGPFSIHFTAGPDAHKLGDRAGMDLANNLPLQQWIQRFKKRGDGIGNHGGWLHDYFGTQVDHAPHREMVDLLERNDVAVRAAAGAPVREYSAPLGNQPEWVTEWIEDRGVMGYYFTGNTGMAPTRSYREGRLGARKIWSFPILTLNQIASFEEASDNSVPGDYMGDWLVSSAEFAADSATVRTFYSHPSGWKLYFGAIEQWFKRTAELLHDGRFHWYTMEQMAEFLNRREQVQWQVMRRQDKDVFQASHTTDLTGMAWRLPKVRYERPVLEQGAADIREADDAWTVVAKEGKSLTFNVSTQQDHP